MNESDPPSPKGVDWIEIRRLCAETKRTIVDIAAEFGVTPDAIYRRRSRQAWPARGSMAASETPPPSPNIPATRKPGERKRLIVRLRAAVIASLTRLEERMKTSSSSSLADDERTTRVIATLTRTVDKIKELEADAKSRRRAKSGPAYTSHDADRLRLELADRIKRLIGRNKP